MVESTHFDNESRAASAGSKRRQYEHPVVPAKITARVTLTEIVHIEPVFDQDDDNWSELSVAKEKLHDIRSRGGTIS